MKNGQKKDIVFSILIWAFKSTLIRMLFNCFEHKSLLWPATMKYDLKEVFWSHYISVTKMEIFGYTNDTVGSSKVHLKTIKPGMDGSAQLFKSVMKIWNWSPNTEYPSLQHYSTDWSIQAAITQASKSRLRMRSYDCILRRHFQLEKMMIWDMNCQGKSSRPFSIT